MRGKIVNLCFGFLNLLFGALIILYTIKVPQDKTLITVQENIVINNILLGIYAVMFSVAFIDLIQSFNHRADTTFNIGYTIGIFILSFWFIKQPFVAVFSILSGLIVLFKSLKENLIELDSNVAISISIVLIGATVILGLLSYNYVSLGQRIKNKENKNELPYKTDYFKYITELNDYSDLYINVKKDGKFGYINQRGEVVIDFTYDYASPFVKIYSFGKEYYIALMCKDGSSYIKLKNGRTVLSYRTESADDNYGAKLEELENVYKNILKQTDEMEFEIPKIETTKNRVPAYDESEAENVKVFDYNEEYDLIVTQSSLGRNDVYELAKKDDHNIKITLDTTNLDYDDNYLYIFKNGYIPFYEISKATQGWFTNYGKKNEMTGRAQILDFLDEERLILKNYKDGSIYFSSPIGQKLSQNYYDIYICGDGRYIVKDDDNYFKIIDDEYNQLFEKKYASFNTRFNQIGLYLALNSFDSIKFNDFGYASMNWILINYDGVEILTDIEYIYDLDLKLEKEKKIFEDNYLIFKNQFKKLDSEFVGDKFYLKTANN